MSTRDASLQTDGAQTCGTCGKPATLYGDQGYRCDEHAVWSNENGVLAVGCSWCGASSGESCWSTVKAAFRLPHANRINFARRLGLIPSIPPESSAVEDRSRG